MAWTNRIQTLIFAIIVCSIVSAENGTIFTGNSTEKRSEESRIVNGIKATENQFPFMVSLRRAFTESHFCGGSIISNKIILTAAHCMFDQSEKMITPKSFFVVAGKISLRAISQSEQKRKISKIKVNSGYDSALLNKDIALITVSRPFVFTAYVNLAPLATQLPSPNTLCYAAGWGYLKENELIVSDDLMFVELPLLNNTTCRRLLGILPQGSFCAGYEEGGKDACQGDSGGPLICNNQVTGIVSGGEGCARPKKPGFYTNVAYYQKWIMKYSNGVSSIFKYKNSAQSIVASLSLGFAVLIFSLYNI